MSGKTKPTAKVAAKVAAKTKDSAGASDFAREDFLVGISGHADLIRPWVTSKVVGWMWLCIALLGIASMVTLIQAIRHDPSIRAHALTPNGTYYQVRVVDVADAALLAGQGQKR